MAGKTEATKNESTESKKENSSEPNKIYNWARIIGLDLLKAYESQYGPDGAIKKMETLLLTLRSESVYYRFRKAVVNTLIEALPDVKTYIPEEIRIERPWSSDEFYMYSTAILSGFYDALNKWREDKEKGSKTENKEESAKGNQNA